MRGVQWMIGLMVSAVALAGISLPTYAMPASGTDFMAFGLQNFSAGAKVDLAFTNPDATSKTFTTTACSSSTSTSWTVPPSVSLSPPLSLSTTVGTQITASNLMKIHVDSEAGVLQFNHEYRNHSADSSQLIDESEWGTSYVVATYLDAFGTSELAVVADSASTVTIVPTVAITAGGGVPAISAGSSYVLSLAACQAVQIVASGDLTGTTVTANTPVGVFEGAKCAYVGNYACDHLEEQAWPAGEWGQKYVICNSPPRVGTAPTPTVLPDYLRAVSLASVTTVVTVLGLPTSPVYTIPPGGFVDIITSGNTYITANEPFELVQFTQGGSPAGSGINGDPAMTQVMPATHFSKSYAFHSFGRSSFELTAAPVGTLVSLDGLPVAGTPILASGFSCYDMGSLAYGLHVVTGNDGVSVQHGYFDNWEAIFAPAFRISDRTLPPPVSCFGSVGCGDGAGAGLGDQCPDVPQGFPTISAWGGVVVTHGIRPGSSGNQAACYDMPTGTWHSLPNPIIPRGDIGAAGNAEQPFARSPVSISLNEGYVAVGGLGPAPGCLGPQALNPCSVVEYLSPVGHSPAFPTWQTESPLKIAVAAPAVVINDGAIYVFGGRPCPISASCMPVDFIQKYTAADGWQVLDGRMPHPRSDAAIVAHWGCGKIYLIGGYGGPTDGALVSTDAFDPCGSWVANALPDLPDGRIAPVAIRPNAFAGDICILGGHDVSGIAVANSNAIDSTTSTAWSTVSTPTLAVPAGDNTGGENSVYISNAIASLVATGPYDPLAALVSC